MHSTMTQIELGKVYTILGGRRRYFCYANGIGGARMIALSGPQRGCHPTSVMPEHAELSADQTVEMSGNHVRTLLGILRNDIQLCEHTGIPSLGFDTVTAIKNRSTFC